MNNAYQHNDDTITVFTTAHFDKVLPLYNQQYFIFKDPRDTKYYHAYFPPTKSFFHDPSSYYMLSNKTQFYVLEDCNAPTDQWDRFIKRLSLLSASIQALIGHPIKSGESNFIFPMPNQDKVVKMVRQINNDKFITLYILDKDDILAKGYTLQYDPQTHEFINQYFMELKNNMNHWLKLEQQ